MTNLDFMPLGDGEVWNVSKEWSGASDSDGFPSGGAFAMEFGDGNGKFQ
jgi:hypothetical protein